MNNSNNLINPTQLHLKRCLKTLRTQHSLSMAKVANDIGVQKKQIWQYEQGHLLPSMRTLIKLCAYYHVTPNYLLGFNDNKS